MILRTYEDLAELRMSIDTGHQRIIFCSGVFDLLHPGHVVFFERCKALGGTLVVSVGDDRSIRSYKGEQRPILDQEARLKMVDSLKAVDYTFASVVPDLKNLFSDLELVFANLRPDIYCINDDAFDIASRQQLAEKFNMQLVVFPRAGTPEEWPNISTNEIIKKIKAS